MTQTRSRRRAWPALLLAAALLAGGGLSAFAVGADKESQAPESPVPEASVEPTPEPTPFPEFDPSTITLRADLLVDGLEAPVYLVDDGTAAKCLYVVEQGGTVRILERDGYLRPQRFLNISKLVASGPEQGLHSIAFHPNFKRNGRFFAHYNAALDGSSVIAEFKGAPCKRANPKPVKIILKVEKEYPNNNAGWIGFGPDGYLYIPLGDGGGRSPGDPDGLGQSKSTPLSKVLRIDINQGKRFVIPKNNPYAKKKRGFHPATWALGLRNPRRASFDRKTGDFWIGDVGQDRYEEIDYIAAKSVPRNGPAPNFGWSQVEGESTCHPNVPDCDPSLYVAPVHFYDKVPPHRAVTGGYVYRGPAIPELDGVYLFSDFASGFIWGLDAKGVAEGHQVTAHLLLDALPGFVSFGEDDQGELYLVSLEGSVYRINTEAG
jgi:glucose/arabinose dehydrogenase